MKFVIPERLKSRKLWVSLLAAVIVFANKYWNLDLKEQDLVLIVTALMGYVGMQGVNDAVTTLRTEPKG